MRYLNPLLFFQYSHLLFLSFLSSLLLLFLSLPLSHLPFFLPSSVSLSSHPTAHGRVVQQPRQLLQPERWPQFLPTVLHYPASLAHQPEGLPLRRRKSVPRKAHGLNHFHPVLLLLIWLQCQHQQRQQHRHGRGGDPGNQSVPKPLHKYCGRAHRTAAHPHPATKISVVLSSKEVSEANSR